MHPRLAFLILPYTRAELAGWARLMRGVGFAHEFLSGFGCTPYGIAAQRSPVRHDVVLRPRAAPTAEFSDWLWK